MSDLADYQRLCLRPISPDKIWIEFLEILTANNGPAFVASPFVTDRVVRIALLKLGAVPGRLLVRGLPADYVNGSLDCYALERFIKAGWSVRYHHKLHAKVYCFRDEFMLGSCNFTNAGLKGPHEGNFECAVRGKGPILEILKLGELWKIATELSLADILAIKNWQIQQPKPDPKSSSPDFPIASRTPALQPFSLRDVPQSPSFEWLSTHLRQTDGLSADDLQIVFHDIDLLDLDTTAAAADIYDKFLVSPLVSAFLKFNGEGKRFGELRAWLTKMVEDVPTPSRADFNSQLNKLYALVVEASQGRYVRTVKGRHSEWLVRKF